MIVARVYQCDIQISEVDTVDNTLDNTTEQQQPIDLFKLRKTIDDDLLSIADLLEDNIKADDVEHEDIVQEMIQKIGMVRDGLANSKMAQLWFQYLYMIDIVCNFIKAERTGNWSLHIKSLCDMLTYPVTIFMQNQGTFICNKCQSFMKVILTFIPNSLKAITLSEEAITSGLGSLQI